MKDEYSEIPEDLQAISYKVIGLAIEVHRLLGPGLLESAYQECPYFQYSIKKLNLTKDIEKIYLSKTN